MKKIKYLLLIMLMTFMPLTFINAESGKINIDSIGIQTSSGARFYDRTATNTLKAVTTNTPNPGFYYYTADFTSTAQGLGGALAFQLNTPIQKDYVYSLSVYIGFGNGSANYPAPFWDSRIALGNTLGQSATNFMNSTNISSILYSTFSSGQSSYYFCDSDNVCMNGYTGVLNFVFKANQSGIAIIVPFSTYKDFTGRFVYYGYNIEPLGNGEALTTDDLKKVINSSGLATAESVEEVNKSVDEVKSQIKESTNKIDNTINNTDVSDSSSTANSFFEGFESDDYGLSDIVTMPLELIKGLTSNTCVALSLTLPFVNKTFELPCMSSIYQEYFGTFYDLYKLITFGFISYWVIVKIFNLVKDFKNPDHDEIEVLDL